MLPDPVTQQEAQLPAKEPFWRAALGGTHQDFTTGSIPRAVVLLATPMVLEMFMESLFAIVDMFWVSRLGADAVATVGLTESMLTFMFAIAFGISMATTAIVARRVGEKDPAGASASASQAILLGTTIALCIGLPAAAFSAGLLKEMGATPSIISVGHTYAAITFASSLQIMLLFLNNAIFRGAGAPAAAMRVLWISNLINLTLDPCLIFGLGPFPALGVTGAAVSTLTGRTCGVIFQFWTLAKGKNRIELKIRQIRLIPSVLRSLARISITGVTQFAIGQMSWLLLVRMVSSFGAAALAGYTIGVRIFLFVLLPSWGLSGAAATMVGQNLGAGKPERASRAVFTTAIFNVSFLGLVSLVFLFFPERLVHLFTTEPVVAQQAALFLRTIALGNLAYAVGMVMVQSLNGAGDTVTPTLINIVGYWVVELPLAYVLAFHLHLQSRGVFTAVPIAEFCITCMGLAAFLSGRWKRKVV
jgi:putative MATE family efflux protein